MSDIVQRARSVLFVLLAISVPLSADTRSVSVRNSLLLLIDTSGSMDSEIGNGNPEIKIEAAKDAAIAAVDRALASGATEVAVMAFEGGCADPISQYLAFTTDANQLTRFIHGLQTGGGTPMAEAVLVANRFMQDNGTPGTHSQMIVLLADGDNDCGDVTQAMDQLRAAGIVFRHETVGFGIEPTSDAARDLRHVANASGGEYHHATTATQLADVFMEFVDTFTVIDMLGMFGGNASGTIPGGQTTSANPSANAGPGAQAGTTADDDKGSFTSMIGMFKTPDADGDATDADDDTVGALAIDGNQGTAWGWAVGEATEADAQRAAVDECGQGCTSVLTFRDGCAAYAADQEPGSSAYGWASEDATHLEVTKAALGVCRIQAASNPYAGKSQPIVETRTRYSRKFRVNRAKGDVCCPHLTAKRDQSDRLLDECASQGGKDCLVRVWACSDGRGGGAAGRGQEPSIAGDMADASSNDTPFGALAVDPAEGTVWGLASGYGTHAEAKSVALEECGAGCEIVLTFEDGCMAYTADHAAGSTIIGWAFGYDTRAEAEQDALDECAQRGGTNCKVLAWDCS